MKEFKVTVTVKAGDIIEAEMLRDGIQNVLSELGSDQLILLQLADRQTARHYATRVRQLINSPLMKQIVKSFV